MTKVAIPASLYQAGLKKFGDIQHSNDPRAPKARITNAPELFGDPMGDIDDDDDDDLLAGDVDDDDEDGDPDLYGDINDDTISVYNMTSGDPSRGRKFGKAVKRAGLVAGSAAAAYAIQRKIAAVRKRKKATRSRIGRYSTQQTLKNQVLARKYAGKIRKDAKMPFFQVTGAKMNSSPINPLEKFVADMFKYNLDRQASDTPFYQETALGVFALGTWTCTATGVATNRFYTGLILQAGINMLNAAPGTIFNVTATLPTIAGTLTVAATPWIFTIGGKFYVTFLFFPWQLVSNKALPVLGQYSIANPIVVSVTGLPAASAVSLVVPGSLHPWTIAMRNSLS